MPRKPRPKRKAKGLRDYTLLERNGWSVNGPIIAGDVEPADARQLRKSRRTVWVSWAAWAKAYAEVRDEFLERRRSKTSPASERLFAAYQAGDDVGAVRDELIDEHSANDPRLKYGRTVIGSI